MNADFGIGWNGPLSTSSVMGEKMSAIFGLMLLANAFVGTRRLLVIDNPSRVRIDLNPAIGYGVFYLNARFDCADAVLSDLLRHLSGIVLIGNEKAREWAL